ncbi:hypothetical protein JOC77_003184 [Peribacillus deserti]|uniref:Uncharacterized protein n=1 Tax=Peribacillus deserti TaxID=673318 RepID=A0ABS2QKN9_9BACI|nr:hypothetical protein [Peribacillus deserti]
MNQNKEVIQHYLKLINHRKKQGGEMDEAIKKQKC